MGEQQDIDLESMSQEDLERFINSEGQPSDESTTQEPEQETQEDTTLDPEEELQEEVQEEDPEATEEVQPEDDGLPERYKGKTAKELVDIIEQQKRYESQRGAEIGQLRSELSNLQNNINEKFEGFEPKTKEEKKDFVSELVSEYGYNENDIKVINRLVEHKAKEIITQQEQERKQKQQEKSERVKQDNLNFWKQVRGLLPNENELDEALAEAYRLDPENTLTKPGWVESYIKSYSKNSPSESKQTINKVNGAKKRAAKTVTVKSASRPSGNMPSKADLDSKDPETYRRAWNYFNPNSQF